MPVRNFAGKLCHDGESMRVLKSSFMRQGEVAWAAICQRGMVLSITESGTFGFATASRAEPTSFIAAHYSCIFSIAC
jgi:hypothetical protein